MGIFIIIKYKELNTSLKIVFRLKHQSLLFKIVKLYKYGNKT
jgi:hypothetical protein